MDVVGHTQLRKLQQTKPTNSLCPPNKRGNVVTAAKDSVAVNKGECWSVRLANVNRVYLRASAHGKYLRSRNPTEAICTFSLSFLFFVIKIIYFLKKIN